MKAAQGHLNDVIRFSAVDGPGNRFVVFLQGCNYNCVACHNPYTINECDSCGKCVEPCPEMALFYDGHNQVAVDDDLCTDCDICIQVCPSDSTPLSKMVRLESLVRQIDEVSPFISGITVSGGEPTLQADFVASLFSSIKCSEKLSRLTTLVDSNGSASRAVWDRLLPVMDGAMIDLKALDPDTHIAMTGADNGPVLDTIRYLAEWQRLYEVRLLMVPGRNDSPDTVERTARWLYDIDPSMRIKLIGFRQHGVRPQFADIPEADPQHLEKLSGIIRGVGIEELVLV
ncbi:MAG: YjjW family glycine radical enzyme activase [Acidimicrobiia bacterium]|nr:YjjW family glycine radical enzyme activase [Acidimicrobiia bacterium]